MSVFSRIDPDHPLVQAVREINDSAELHGFEETTNQLDFGTGVGELFYLAEQRVLRALGTLVFGTADLTEAQAQLVVTSPFWTDVNLRSMLLSIHIDGVSTGWRGKEIAETEKAAKVSA